MSHKGIIGKKKKEGMKEELQYTCRNKGGSVSETLFKQMAKRVQCVATRARSGQNVGHLVEVIGEAEVSEIVFLFL
jgi:hypothetical protein